jgi:cyclic pyranopterin phosphate synthase
MTDEASPPRRRQPPHEGPPTEAARGSDTPGGLTHIDAGGAARMVDVSAKQETRRRAVATGRIRMAPETLARVLAGDAPKGDVLGVARIAGIQGGKRTADLIPLCHVLPGASVNVTLVPDPDLPGIVVRVEATVTGQTGVEMEALTAASVALLTVYDMAKALDRDMVIEQVRLERKEGGRSGLWERSEKS